MAETLTRVSNTAACESEPLVGSYFVAAYPPFSCWNPENVPLLTKALDTAPPQTPLSLYLHVPFCQKKCDFCYYLSFAGSPASVIDGYIHSVVEELSLYSQRPALKGRPLAFVYFGGGTPSMLTPIQVGRLAAGLKRSFPFAQGEEITFECAPRSARPELLSALREIGVTRISMGVQSFDDEVLRLNGRVHARADLLRAYGLIREAGFDWVNLDLMCGMLGETDLNWRESMRRIIALAPESVTVYQTEIPHNTRLYQYLKCGLLPAPPASWDVKRARLDYAFTELDRAGYTVVSAYNAVRDPVRHQFQYQEHLWRGGDMLGIGVASFGYMNGVHYQNHVTLENYGGAIRNGTLPAWRAYPLTDRDRLVRELILQLKLGQVSTAAFQKKFGVNILDAFSEPLAQLQHEGMLATSSDSVHLTPEGVLRVDRLLPRFYDPFCRDVRYT